MTNVQNGPYGASGAGLYQFAPNQTMPGPRVVGAQPYRFPVPPVPMAAPATTATAQPIHFAATPVTSTMKQATPASMPLPVSSGLANTAVRLPSVQASPPLPCAQTMAQTQVAASPVAVSTPVLSAAPTPSAAFVAAPVGSMSPGAAPMVSLQSGQAGSIRSPVGSLPVGSLPAPVQTEIPAGASPVHASDQEAAPQQIVGSLKQKKGKKARAKKCVCCQ